MFFFDRVLTSILGRFLEAPNPEIIDFPMGKLQISQNRRFREKCQTTSILESFSEAETTKNRENMMLKNMFFFDIDFLALFCDFLRFWLDFGSPRALKKLRKIEKNRFLNAFIFEGGFWEGSGSVLGRFFDDFERILRGF